MNAVTSAIIWMTVQVLLFSLVGGATFLLLRRRGSSAAGACAAMVLGLTLSIVLLIVSPWPRWIGKFEVRNSNSAISSNSKRGDQLNKHFPADAGPVDERFEGASGSLFSTIIVWGNNVVQLLESGDFSIDGQKSTEPRGGAWIPWVFAIGMGWGLVRLAAGLWAVGKLRRQSSPVEDT